MQVRKPSDNFGERNFTRATGVLVIAGGAIPHFLNLIEEQRFLRVLKDAVSALVIG